MDKYPALLELTHRRQTTRWPPHRCIGDYQGGAYECDFVSPYTKSAGNLEATVMVLLQDWSSDAGLSGELDPDARDLGYTRRSPTNVRLQERLLLHFGFSLREVYATNVFPFVKVGPMNAPIRAKDLLRAAFEFALPQIAIVRPVIAVCLGKAAFNAVRVAAGNNECPLLDEAIASPFVVGATEIWCQAHTGSIGTNNRNRDDSQRVTKVWARMADTYHNQMQRTSAAQAADPRC